MARKSSPSAVPGILSMSLSTRLTLGEPCVRLREQVRAALDGGVGLLVDASSVTHIDSSGLGELVAGWNALAERGLSLKLVRPSSRVVLMLETAKLETTLERFEDQAAAIASFGPRE